MAAIRRTAPNDPRLATGRDKHVGLGNNFYRHSFDMGVFTVKNDNDPRRATRDGKPAYVNAPPRLRASQLQRLFVPEEPRRPSFMSMFSKDA